VQWLSPHTPTPLPHACWCSGRNSALTGFSRFVLTASHYSLSFCPPEATSSVRAGWQTCPRCLQPSRPTWTLPERKLTAAQLRFQENFFTLLTVRFNVPDGYRLFKKSRAHLVTGFRVQSRAGIYCELCWFWWTSAE